MVLRPRGHRRGCPWRWPSASEYSSPRPSFQAYLFAALAGLGPAMGCLLLVFIHRMTGGAWGRDAWSRAGRRLPPGAVGAALGCVPLVIWTEAIYSPGPSPDNTRRARLARCWRNTGLLLQYRAAFVGRSVVVYVSSCVGYGLAGAPPPIPVDRTGRHDRFMSSRLTCSGWIGSCPWNRDGPRPAFR